MDTANDLFDLLSPMIKRGLGDGVRILAVHPVGGGSINSAYRLTTDRGRCFVKWNSAARFPSLFEAEADGLERLRASGTIRVPAIIDHGEVNGRVYLILEHIEGGLRTPAFWSWFGRDLARLHRRTWSHFGLERDNHIGSLEQRNTPHDRWDAFFIAQRLEPQVRMARDHQRLGMPEVRRFELLYARLGELMPPAPPSLLHGDLWSGNQLCDEQERPVLIDPAVYHGHREMDLAMTRLFGGFDEALYAAYDEEWPIEPLWEERVDLFNLYPLLVHVNLFGGGYAQQVGSVLRRFT